MRKVIEDKNTMKTMVPSEFDDNKVYCLKVSGRVCRLVNHADLYIWTYLEGTNDYGGYEFASGEEAIALKGVYEFDTIREALDYFEVE